MTEAEWINSTDPSRMLEFLRGPASERKLRLFAVAWCRRMWRLFTAKRLQAAVEASERYADGLASSGELEQPRRAAERLAERAFRRKVRAMPWATAVQGKVARNVAVEVASADINEVLTGVDAPLVPARTRRDYEQKLREEQRHQADLLRDFFGPLPFRPLPLSPSLLGWRDGLVVRLAQVVYDDRLLPSGHLDPARLSLLADGLLDAGCDNAELLDHLRQPGLIHVRGCYVVDLVLGKS